MREIGGKEGYNHAIINEMVNDYSDDPLEGYNIWSSQK
jgi:hypothetical protein